MEITRLKLSELEPNAGQIPGLPMNPRQWTKSDVDKLARSLKETPELFEARPIIVTPNDGKYIILGGNLRYEGARTNKDKDAPCIIIPEGTPIEKMKEIVIKDNGSFGAWDWDMLANEWDDHPLSDWGVPAWNPEPAFHPNLQPIDGIKPVTDADIAKAGEAIIEEVTPTEKQTIEVICPHCGKVFQFKV